MAENKNTDSKVGKKTTLTLGGDKNKKLLEKIKEGFDQQTHVVKGRKIVNSKLSLKSNLSGIPPLGKSKFTNNPNISNSSLKKNISSDEDSLTEKEKQSRLKALEKARQNTATSTSASEPFIGFSVVESPIEKAEDTVIKKEKKVPQVKEVEKEEVLEEKVVKKKTSTKKKDKNESERAWKDAYYEEDIEEELDSEVESQEEEDSFVKEEEIRVKVSEAVATTTFVNTATKRVGKTRKDKSGSKLKVKKEVTITGHESVKTLAHMLGERLKDFLNTLDKLNLFIDNGEDTVLDVDTAEMVILELGHVAKRQCVEEEIMALYKYADKEEDLQPKPPVVTIMGHVDHGKTTLLDYIRKTNVVSKESGGITQHIGAYQITSENNKLITFLDTPGHEAFAEMRARGALVTDIIVLVVAADDGLKQQSIEVINHAQSANVPIVVAINKIDKPGANSSKVKTELLQYNVVVEEMGGKVLSAEISALKGTGILSLLENILLEAELLDLKANKKRTAISTVIEAKVEKGKGIVATVIVQNGLLKQGDLFVVGDSFGKVRFLTNDKGKQIKSAEPGMPVEIVGFSKEVSAGDEIIVVKSEADAKKIIEYKQSLSKKEEQTENNDIGLLLSTQGDVSYLPVIIKTDVFGSKEAILGSLEKIGNDEVKIKVVHAGVGAINESDVLLAKTAKAIICGFNVRANNQAKVLADSEKVNISYFSIIYDLLDILKERLSGLLQPKVIENILGYAEIKEVFNISKVGKIAGCMVKEGVIKKSAGVRLLRDNVVIYEGTLLQLKRFKDDAKEVNAGQECGVMLQNFQDLAKGDSIECFEKITEKRELK